MEPRELLLEARKMRKEVGRLSKKFHPPPSITCYTCEEKPKEERFHCPYCIQIEERQVKDAIDKGTKVLCGGKRIDRKGYFYEPTVLTNIKKNMLVLKEEVFGPAASVLSFKSIKEAIKLANNTKYGLGASVWTQNNKTAEAMIKSIESGMIWINDFGTPYPQCPQGGIKESGLGRELSKYGILEFCNMKTLVISEDKTIKKSWWFPYNE